MAAGNSKRRAFLRAGLQASVAAGAGKMLPVSAHETGNPQWMNQPGQAFLAYGQPAPQEGHVIRRVGLNYRGIDDNGAAWCPLEQLQGAITPNGLHFVRNHAGTPAIEPDHHQLYINGLVEKPLQFSVASLLRYPQVSRQLFIECGGNSSAGWSEYPVQRTAGLTHGLVSASEWTGVPVRMLLEEAGVKVAAQWAVATGNDPGAFSMSIPLDKLMDDCLIALYQNGERLRPENGYPMRLLVPGWKGVLSVKWLGGLQLSENPAMSRNETAHYTEILPSGLSRQFTTVMEVKSLITSPSHGMTLAGPGVQEITGLAWSGHGRIAKVEVSTDGGKTWADAELCEAPRPMALTRFRTSWKWDGEDHILQSRATDEHGHVQPTRQALVAARGDKGFYHYNAIVSWEVNSFGLVSHVYV